LQNHVLSLILLNIIIYILILSNIFFIIFLHDTKFFKTTNEFKNIVANQYILVILLLAILSMAGMPPLFGFFGKFLIVLFFFKKSQFALFFCFIFLNIFVMYFYILNIRFLLIKCKKSYYYIKKYCAYLNINFINMLLVVTVGNVFGIFFINDLIFYINTLCSFNF